MRFQISPLFPGTFVLLLLSSLPAIADDTPQPALGVARISALSGDVATLRGDSGDWIAAAVNIPLVEGDSIRTLDASRAEVQLDAGNVVRITGDTEVQLVELGEMRFRVRVLRGTALYSEWADSAADIDIETPRAAVRPSAKGRYRVFVAEDWTLVEIREGEAEIAFEHSATTLGKGQQLTIWTADEKVEFEVGKLGNSDAFDRWAVKRDKELRRTAARQYISRDIYGIETLHSHGRWRNVRSVGWCWFPRVSVGWAPYRHGHWIWVPHYGWTWVPDEPWGWAPSHWGRWHYDVSFGWGWYPGAPFLRHVWRPALVSFAWGGYSLAGPGYVAWSPLGLGEVYRPWYGWGRGGRLGPRGGSSTQITEVVVNVNNSPVRRAGSWHGNRATVGGSYLRTDEFASGRAATPRSIRLGMQSRTQPIRGPVPVVPSRSSQGRLLPASSTSVRAAPAAGWGRVNVSRLRDGTERPSFEDQRAQMRRTVDEFNRTYTRTGRIGSSLAGSASGSGATASGRSGGERRPSTIVAQPRSTQLGRRPTTQAAANPGGSGGQSGVRSASRPAPSGDSTVRKRPTASAATPTVPSGRRLGTRTAPVPAGRTPGTDRTLTDPIRLGQRGQSVGGATPLGTPASRSSGRPRAAAAPSPSNRATSVGSPRPAARQPSMPVTSSGSVTAPTSGGPSAAARQSSATDGRQPMRSSGPPTGRESSRVGITYPSATRARAQRSGTPADNQRSSSAASQAGRTSPTGRVVRSAPNAESDRRGLANSGQARSPSTTANRRTARPSKADAPSVPRTDVGPAVVPRLGSRVGAGRPTVSGTIGNRASRVGSTRGATNPTSRPNSTRNSPASRSTGTPRRPSQGATRNQSPSGSAPTSTRQPQSGNRGRPASRTSRPSTLPRSPSSSAGGSSSRSRYGSPPGIGSQVGSSRTGGSTSSSGRSERFSTYTPRTSSRIGAPSSRPSGVGSPGGSAGGWPGQNGTSRRSPTARTSSQRNSSSTSRGTRPSASPTSRLGSRPTTTGGSGSNSRYGSSRSTYGSQSTTRAPSGSSSIGSRSRTTSSYGSGSRMGSGRPTPSPSSRIGGGSGTRIESGRSTRSTYGGARTPSRSTSRLGSSSNTGRSGSPPRYGTSRSTHRSGSRIGPSQSGSAIGSQSRPSTGYGSGSRIGSSRPPSSASSRTSGAYGSLSGSRTPTSATRTPSSRAGRSR